MAISTFARQLMRWALGVAISCCAAPASAQQAPTGPAWASVQRTLTDAYSMGEDIAIGADGSQYTTGIFEGTLTLGKVKLTASTGTTHIFLAKYSPDGEALWITNLDGSGYVSSNNIAVDLSGNVYVAGTFNRDITLGATTLKTSSSDVYLAKYNTQGVQQWVRQGGGQNHKNLKGIATNAQGEVIVAGDFQASIDFGGQALVDGGIFYYRFSPDGKVNLAKSFGSWASSMVNVAGLTLDKEGSAYITGDCGGSLTFGSDTIYSSYQDIFVCKLTAAGTPVWSQFARATPDRMKQVRAIAVDESGNTVVCGENFDYNPAKANLYVAHFNAKGSLTWSYDIPTSSSGSPETGYNSASGVAYDHNGGFLVTGAFLGKAVFGTNELNTINGQVFVVRYDGQGNATAVLHSVGLRVGNDHSYGHGIAVDTKGNIYVAGTIWGDASFGKVKTFADYNMCDTGTDSYIAKLTVPAVTTSVETPEAVSRSAVFAIYPNPASQRTTIMLRGGERQLLISDARGSLIRKQAVTGMSGPYSVSLSGLASGLYQLRVTTDNGQTRSAKLVVE
ncbi:SBBP repeat-containing protein [Hymenobacter guriensis]|uniref:SBBP repeat-containing protein n=1 Tax=Hymenobacter guriensis TaxID=2793065 RepID=A0ABS0KXR2_9BACT|nr:SBBP repeat-containing protein [Hymenobacter guriensis]MBG8552634.1 SBBP repeat-containing protein [Hymenobacter guriensis]